MKSLFDQNSELEQRATVQLDIFRIKDLLQRDDKDEKELRDLHVELDGKYQAKIENWGNGMSDYNIHSGFNYKFLDKSSLIPNLQLMMWKLKGFALGFNKVSSSYPSNSQGVNVIVNNAVNITISIGEAKRKIDKIPGLTDTGSNEIKSKLDELEQIFKEENPKKKRCEKIIPILKFALDKGTDVAIVFLELVLPKLFGM